MCFFYENVKDTWFLTNTRIKLKSKHRYKSWSKVGKIRILEIIFCDTDKILYAIKILKIKVFLIYLTIEIRRANCVLTSKK